MSSMFSLFSSSRAVPSGVFSYALTAAAGVSTDAPSFADPHRLRRALSREARALMEELVFCQVVEEAAFDDDVMRALCRCTPDAAVRVLVGLRERQTNGSMPPISGWPLKSWLQSRIHRAEKESGLAAACPGSTMFRRALSGAFAAPASPPLPPLPCSGREPLDLDLRTRGQLSLGGGCSSRPASEGQSLGHVADPCVLNLVLLPLVRAGWTIDEDTLRCFSEFV